MKKIAAILVLALCFLACSKDNGPITATGDTAPKIGRFVYSENDITAEIDISDKVSISIYKYGLNMYQQTYGLIRLDWPAYEYVFNNLVLLCTYDNCKEFTAYVDANGTGIDLPRYMRFTYDKNQ